MVPDVEIQDMGIQLHWQLHTTGLSKFPRKEENIAKFRLAVAWIVVYLPTFVVSP